jgi:hypothetical protein
MNFAKDDIRDPNFATKELPGFAGPLFQYGIGGTQFPFRSDESDSDEDSPTPVPNCTPIAPLLHRNFLARLGEIAAFCLQKFLDPPGLWGEGGLSAAAGRGSPTKGPTPLDNMRESSSRSQQNGRGKR